MCVCGSMDGCIAGDKYSYVYIQVHIFLSQTLVVKYIQLLSVLKIYKLITLYMIQKIHII